MPPGPSGARPVVAREDGAARAGRRASRASGRAGARPSPGSGVGRRAVEPDHLLAAGRPAAGEDAGLRLGRPSRAPARCPETSTPPVLELVEERRARARRRRPRPRRAPCTPERGEVLRGVARAARLQLGGLVADDEDRRLAARPGRSRRRRTRRRRSRRRRPPRRAGTPASRLASARQLGFAEAAHAEVRTARGPDGQFGRGAVGARPGACAPGRRALTRPRPRSAPGPARAGARTRLPAAVEPVPAAPGRPGPSARAGRSGPA